MVIKVPRAKNKIKLDSSKMLSMYYCTCVSVAEAVDSGSVVKQVFLCSFFFSGVTLVTPCMCLP